ncbi:MAG: hypothetical protein H7256_02745 [Bdellovibrio sp.]|nr:hypothetical protein [Bdellovibrio sp.]
MSELMKLIQDADVAAVDLEKARGQVETAKQSLETAKELHEQARLFLDEILSRAEVIGIPRAKIKKLVEERTQILVASGLMPAAGEARVAAPKTAKVSKKTKAAVEELTLNDSPMVPPEEDHEAIQFN